jgi:hypothetical protein
MPRELAALAPTSSLESSRKIVAAFSEKSAKLPTQKAQ